MIDPAPVSGVGAPADLSKGDTRFTGIWVGLSSTLQCCEMRHFCGILKVFQHQYEHHFIP